MVVTAVMLLLAACSPAEGPDASAETATATASPSPSPTPTIPVGPVTLTTEEAAARYLGIVCQRNVAAKVVQDAIFAQEDAYLNGGGDVLAIAGPAAEMMRLSRQSVELFDDEYYTWPDGLDEHLAVVRQANLAEVGTLDTIVNAGRVEDAIYATWPSVDSSAAVQEIRYQLGLPGDTTASCSGYETTSDVLKQQMIERTEYLAQFHE